jgi:hypothetical protein
MAETAALLADEVLPERPLRQWVLSLPHARLVAIVARFGGWGRVAPTALLPPARESLCKGSRPSRFPHHLAQEQLAHRKQHPRPRGSCQIPTPQPGRSFTALNASLIAACV